MQNLPTPTREDADRILQQIKIESIVQLRMIREQLFLDAVDETASFKDRMALAEHLVKSTPIESEMKKLEGPKNVFQFGFNFNRPDGSSKLVGNVIDSEAAPAAMPEASGMSEWPGEAFFPEFAFVEMEDD